MNLAVTQPETNDERGNLTMKSNLDRSSGPPTVKNSNPAKTGSSESVDDAPKVDLIHEIPLRRPGRYVAMAIIALIVAIVLQIAVTSPNMRWDVVGQFLFAEPIMRGLVVTLELTAISMITGVVLGTVLAAMLLSESRILRVVARTYSAVVRGTPLLTQLLFFYFLAAVLPQLSVGVPFTDLVFISWDTNTVISQFMAAYIALAINEAAYASEIIRAGLNAVDPEQTRAADSLGLSSSQTFFRIVLPQAMRTIIPPLGNDLISLLKSTSLVIVIALPDLLTSAQIIYSQNFLQIPLLIVACFWYLAVFAVLSVGQHYLERHFNRGAVRRSGKSQSRRPKGGGILGLGRNALAGGRR